MDDYKQIIQTLSDHGLKVTPQRVAVLSCLLSS